MSNKKTVHIIHFKVSGYIVKTEELAPITIAMKKMAGYRVFNNFMEAQAK